jgi:predicted nucleic acid-binding protein
VTPIVVDASVAACWLFDDESDPRAAAALAALADAPGIVPSLWHYEIRNVLLVARRRQRISGDGLAERVAALADLPLETDNDPDLDAALALAERHGLSFYDGLYLELACRRQAVLASLDDRLVTAGRAEGVAGDELRHSR